jgi:hypothetical protein
MEALGRGLVPESVCFGGDAAEMALLVSCEVGVTVHVVAGEGFGGMVDIECGGGEGGGFFAGVGGSGEGEEMVGDDALRRVVSGGLAIWMAVLEVRCLT